MSPTKRPLIASTEETRSISKSSNGRSHINRRSITSSTSRPDNKKVTSACLACRRRKSKCNGGPPPCKACIDTNTECVIDESLDRRRRAPRKVYDQLDLYKPVLDRVFDSLRAASATDLEGILSLIRKNAPTSQILALIEKGSESSPENIQPRDDQDVKSVKSTPESATQVEDEQYVFPSKTDRSQSQSTIEASQRSPTTDEFTLHSNLSARADLGYIFRNLLQSSDDDALKLLRELRGNVDSGGESEGNETHRSLNAGDAALRHDQLQQHMNRDTDLEPGYENDTSNYPRESATKIVPAIENQPSYTSQHDRRNWHPSLQPQSSNVFGHTDASDGSSYETYSYDRKSTSRSERQTYPDTQDKLAEPTKDSQEPGHSQSENEKEQSPDESRTKNRLSRDRSLWWPTPGYVEVFGNLPLSSAIMANGYPSTIQSRQLMLFQAPEHLLLPLITDSTSFLSKTFLSYRSAALQMLHDGVPISEVFGPTKPNVDLLFRERKQADTHSVSNWAAELSRGFVGFELPLRVSAAAITTYFMRWLILPTAENYASIPENHRPTRLQRMIPHCPSVDILPFPALRDTLCIKLRDFMTPLEESRMTVNWPHDVASCITHNPQTGHIHLSQAFEEHAVMNTNSASVSSSFLNAFPELRGKIKISKGSG